MGAENIIYGADYMTVSGMLKEIEQEVRRRSEDFEEEKLDDITITPQKFAEKQMPQYIVIDIVQELYTLISKEGRAEEMDILEEASKWGIYVIAASNPKIPIRSGKLMDALSMSKSGVILGNIKEQKVFDYSGIREENRQAEYGYQHTNGLNRKMMLARYVKEE